MGKWCHKNSKETRGICYRVFPNWGERHAPSLRETELREGNSGRGALPRQAHPTDLFLSRLGDVLQQGASKADGSADTAQIRLALPWQCQIPLFRSTDRGGTVERAEAEEGGCGVKV